MRRQPYVIGLTGNIATGKGHVGQMLSDLGAEHIDADRLAHRAMAQGTLAWRQIREAFGPEVISVDGAVDRKKLGAIVFSDPEALARLEEILHPKVIERTKTLIAASTAPVVVVEAIKLIESGMVRQLCDAVWVVTAPREVQVRRLMHGRDWSYEDAVLRVDAQPPQKAKIAHADIVIDNGGSIDATRQQVEEAWAAIGQRIAHPDAP